MTERQEFGLDRIGQVSIRAKDVGRAEAFYRDVLGMRHLFTVPASLAFFECGGVRLMLSAPENEAQDHPGSVLYYTVPDIHQATETLQSRGVHFVSAPHVIAEMPDHTLWMAFFQDSEGNLLGLMSEVPRG